MGKLPRLQLPTQGRTLAVMQVSGGSQSFNAVNTLRLQGRCVRMITIPNQSSVTEAFMEFDEDGRMKPSIATIVSPLDENSGHAASTICATRPACSPAIFKGMPVIE